MKKLLWVLLVLWPSVGLVTSGTGLDSQQRGVRAMTLSEWQRLAEAGDAGA
jgi:hypothetical protein